MKVLRLCRLGIPAHEYEPMVRLLRDVLGLQVEFAEAATTELSLPSGDRVQVFAPGDPYFAFFREHARGPVALFEVDDVRHARRDLDAAGIEVIGEIERDGDWELAAFPRARRQPLRARQPAGIIRLSGGTEPDRLLMRPPPISSNRVARAANSCTSGPSRRSLSRAARPLRRREKPRLRGCRGIAPQHRSHGYGQTDVQRGEGAWEDDPNADGWWGGDPPFRHPVFILTHHHRETVTKEGGTTFTFVTEGIEVALERARAAAGGKDVALGGGANVAQQYLKAGLLDELQIHLVPVLLGDGVRLFENHLGAEHGELECTRVSSPRPSPTSGTAS